MIISIMMLVSTLPSFYKIKSVGFGITGHRSSHSVGAVLSILHIINAILHCF